MLTACLLEPSAIFQLAVDRLVKVAGRLSAVDILFLVQGSNGVKHAEYISVVKMRGKPENRKLGDPVAEWVDGILGQQIADQDAFVQAIGNNVLYGDGVVLLGQLAGAACRLRFGCFGFQMLFAGYTKPFDRLFPVNRALFMPIPAVSSSLFGVVFAEGVSHAGQ